MGNCSACGAVDPDYSASNNGSNTQEETGSNNGSNSNVEADAGCKHGDTATVTNPATCTTAGYEIVTCNICQTVVSKNLISALGHTNTITVEDATCSKNGVKIVTCDRCDKFDYTIIPATGRHTYVDGICSSCRATDPNKFTSDFQSVQMIGGTAY